MVMTTTGMITPGEKLRRARVLRGWTQGQCDEAAGVKTGRTYSYERGAAKPSPMYLAPLAIAWGIPVEWFFDGEDDAPTSTPTGAVVAPQSSGLPVYGFLPASKCDQGAISGTEPARVAFPLPIGSHYRRIAGAHLSSVLMRGDLVLLVPCDLAIDDTLAVCQWPGSCDVADMQRNADGDVMPRAVSDDQRLPSGDASPTWLIVEVKRTLATGVVLALENQSGLSAEMLRTIWSAGTSV